MGYLMFRALPGGGVMDAAFITRLGSGVFEEMHTVTREKFEFFTDFKELEMHGFTEKAKQWSGFF